MKAKEKLRMTSQCLLESCVYSGILIVIGIKRGKAVSEVVVQGQECFSQVQKYLVYNTEEYPAKNIKLAIKWKQL